MAETAEAVVMTCIENPHNEVEGLDSRKFTVHAVLSTPKGFEEVYVTKILEPDSIASQVAAGPILMEREEFYFKTIAKVEPDTQLKIEISSVGEANQPASN
jgi:hypothetical protein